LPNLQGEKFETLFLKPNEVQDFTLHPVGYRHPISSQLEPLFNSQQRAI
jgi:hypothetical protein